VLQHPQQLLRVSAPAKLHCILAATHQQVLKSLQQQQQQQQTQQQHR
jgi:hypothetical protein